MCVMLLLNQVILLYLAICDERHGDLYRKDIAICLRSDVLELVWLFGVFGSCDWEFSSVCLIMIRECYLGRCYGRVAVCRILTFIRGNI